ncbi:hypothetical protein [Crateriforma conspicua]|uniref:hypothetical protein n=1 Tax=Crateriforma conspicua TaxID=2527996 RepID=UPI00118910C5|nr:hypothetical protein [Crateriforma conspicua]QDV61324.1 hypothetical protein Mal65_04470 [Crateriforma conspicua]
MSESPNPQRAAVMRQCREDRRAMLKRWDESGEAVIDRYETETLALRGQLAKLAGSVKRQVQQKCEPLIRQAEERRIEVLSRFDQEKNTPSSARQKDDQAIRQAHHRAAAAIEPLRSWMHQHGTDFGEVREDAAAYGRLELRPPDSIRQSVESMHDLTARIEQLNQELHGLRITRIHDHFWFPIGGIVIGLLLAMLLLFTADASPIAAGSTFVAALVIGIAAHFATIGPLQKKMASHQNHACDLIAAVEHAKAKAMRVSASIHQLEASDLAKKRDKDLAVIDRWLEEQKQAVAAEIEASTKDKQETLKQKLAELDQTFQQQFESNEDRMRQQADELAMDIQKRLENVS